MRVRKRRFALKLNPTKSDLIEVDPPSSNFGAARDEEDDQEHELTGNNNKGQKRTNNTAKINFWVLTSFAG